MAHHKYAEVTLLQTRVCNKDVGAKMKITLRDFSLDLRNQAYTTYIEVISNRVKCQAGVKCGRLIFEPDVQSMFHERHYTIYIVTNQNGKPFYKV